MQDARRSIRDVVDGHNMPDAIGSDIKSFAADGAGKWFLICVNENMSV